MIGCPLLARKSYFHPVILSRSGGPKVAGYRLRFRVTAVGVQLLGGGGQWRSVAAATCRWILFVQSSGEQTQSRVCLFFTASLWKDLNLTRVKFGCFSSCLQRPAVQRVSLAPQRGAPVGSEFRRKAPERLQPRANSLTVCSINIYIYINKHSEKDVLRSQQIKFWSSSGDASFFIPFIFFNYIFLSAASSAN